MMERLPSKVIAAALVAGIGVSACSSSGGGESTKAKSESHGAVAGKSSPAPNLPNVQVKYFQNGSRELIVKAINDSGKLDTADGLGKKGTGLTDIYEWCDGVDLVEETMGWSSTEFNNGTLTTSMSRTVGYAACADGRLTPSDFAASASETN